MKIDGEPTTHLLIIRWPVRGNVQSTVKNNNQKGGATRNDLSPQLRGYRYGLKCFKGRFKY